MGELDRVVKNESAVECRLFGSSRPSLVGGTLSSGSVSSPSDPEPSRSSPDDEMGERLVVSAHSPQSRTSKKGLAWTRTSLWTRNVVASTLTSTVPGRAFDWVKSGLRFGMGDSLDASREDLSRCGPEEPEAWGGWA